MVTEIHKCPECGRPLFLVRLGGVCFAEDGSIDCMWKTEDYDSVDGVYTELEALGAIGEAKEIVNQLLEEGK